jgi:hypothetical protein
MKHEVIDCLEPVCTARYFSTWHLATSKPMSVIMEASYWAKHHPDLRMRVGDRVEIMANIGGDALEHGRFIVAAVERSRARLEAVSKLEAA